MNARLSDNVHGGNRVILITGATGFVGSNLVRHFVGMGWDVHIIARRTSSYWRIADLAASIQNHDADLSDYARLKEIVSQVRPDVIVHTATFGGHSFQKDRDSIYRSNFTGTMNLLNACQGIDYKMFINTGSSSEYGVVDKRMKETDRPDPQDDYGVSKTAATMYCRSIARSEKRPIVTLRLFSPYGYYDAPGRLIPTVILSALRGIPPSLSSRAFVRDFIFIDDIVDAYVKTIMSRPAGGEIFNIGSGRQYSIGDVTDRILHLMGNPVQPVWGNQPKRDNEPAIWKADISKAMKSMQWKPLISLDEGLKATIDWLREHRQLYDGGAST